jgi:hypothetical protein
MPNIGVIIGIGAVVGIVAVGLIAIDVQEAKIRKFEQLDRGDDQDDQ